MKRITLISSIVGFALCAATVTFVYFKKHPDPDSIVSIENSWLSPDEKMIALKRYARLTCDDIFKSAFKEGVLVVSNGTFEQFDEQKTAYITSRQMVISDMQSTYLGVYACTLPKDGSQGKMRVSLDAGVEQFLKK